MAGEDGDREASVDLVEPQPAEPEAAPERSHKSHKSKHSKKSHKHKHKERSHRSHRDSSEERQQANKAAARRSPKEVGSDPESGEILSGPAGPGQDAAQHASPTSKNALSLPVTDARSPGRQTHEDGNRGGASRLRNGTSEALPGDAQAGDQENGEANGTTKDSRKRSRSPELPRPPALPEQPHKDSRSLDGSDPADRDRSKRSRSQRDASREGTRDRDRERDRHTDRDRDRDRERDRDRDRQRDRSRERLRERERDRDRDRGRADRDRSRERLSYADRERQRQLERERERERGRRGGGRSRSRSRDRQRGGARRDEEGRGHRASSRQPEDSSRRGDERREGRDRDRGRDASRQEASAQQDPESDVEIDIDLDPEEAERRQVEEARRRRAELAAKLAQDKAHTESVVNPTATALARGEAAQEPAGASNGADATAGAGTSAAADGDAGDEDMAPAGAAPVPADGDRTPEGDRTSSSDSEGVAKGPVFEIWGNEILADDAESRPPIEEPPSSRPGSVTVAERVHAVEVTHPDAAAGAAGGAAAGPSTASGDDEDDMFAAAAAGSDDDKPGAAAGAAGKRKRGDGGAGAALKKRGAAGAMADSYDDVEGYYNFQMGEVMDNRYEVFASNGKGVFSVVVRARDQKRQDEQGNHPEVAIKLIRSNETMYKAAQTELRILKLLGDQDPENKKHCIRLQRSFEYRNHMCMVFEPMEMNLRDLTKKVGRNKGLNVEAVQLFTCQLLIALRHLKKNNVLHADIKPDNILINHRHNKVKLCDFGSAMMAGDNEVTPYLVSRFYRAPEVVLGIPYDYAMDMWSIGCVIYELITGRILFPGHSNNEMLKLHMDVKGPFSKRMLRRGAFFSKHFDLEDPTCPFISVETDPITKTQVRKLIHQTSPKFTFATLLAKSHGDKTKIAHLADLLEKMMMLEPERRIDPDAALRHPFVREMLPRKEPGHKKRQKTGQAQ